MSFNVFKVDNCFIMIGFTLCWDNVGRHTKARHQTRNYGNKYNYVMGVGVCCPKQGIYDGIKQRRHNIGHRRTSEYVFPFSLCHGRYKGQNSAAS